jgi:DNA-binding NtrC family response regulator
MTRRVLVVDDDAVVRASVHKVLGRAGLETTEAASGVEALSLLAAGGFDLVISDIRMPNMDGVQLLREMKARNPAQPAIVMTAYAEVPLAVDAMLAGAADYLRKPFTSEELRSAVRLALERAAAPKR